jgi:hypothetical protein
MQWFQKLEAQHWAEPVSLTFHSALKKLNTEPSICASHQISVHFGTAFPLKPLDQMIWNLVRSIYGRSYIEIAHFVLIH